MSLASPKRASAVGSGPLLFLVLSSSDSESESISVLILFFVFSLSEPESLLSRLRFDISTSLSSDFLSSPPKRKKCTRVMYSIQLYL